MPPEEADLASEACPALRPLTATRAGFPFALILRQALDRVRKAYRRVLRERGVFASEACPALRPSMLEMGIMGSETDSQAQVERQLADLLRGAQAVAGETLQPALEKPPHPQQRHHGKAAGYY